MDSFFSSQAGQLIIFMQAPHFFLNPYPIFFDLLMMGYMMLSMNMLMWLIIGGLVGSAIAAMVKNKPQYEFYVSIVLGVSFIALSAYALLTSKMSSEVTQSATFILATLCGGGALYLNTRKNYSDIMKGGE